MTYLNTRKKRVGLEQEKVQRLAQMAISGPEESFRQLVLDHQQAVRVFLSRYVYCSQQIEDLAQEVFVAAYQKLDDFRGESGISTWLLGIARNRALHFVRTELRRQRHEDLFANTASLRHSLECLTRESERDEDRMTALLDCLELLPQYSKDLVNQFYFDGQSSVAIAKVSNQKESAVRMKLKRIRGVLQKCITSKLPVSTGRRFQFK